MNTADTTATKLTAADIGEALDMAADMAYVDHGAPDGSRLYGYVDTYTVFVGAIPVRVNVQANNGEYRAASWSIYYGHLGNVVLTGEMDLLTVARRGGQTRRALHDFLREDRGCLSHVMRALRDHAGCDVHRLGDGVDDVLVFPHLNTGEVLNLAESAAIEYAKRFASGFGDEAAGRIRGTVEAKAERIGDPEFFNAVSLDIVLLDAAMGELDKWSEPAEAFLYDLRQPTPWSRGVNEVAGEYGRELRFTQIGFKIFRK